MANGTRGDHPITDIVVYGMAVYSESVDQLVREIVSRLGFLRSVGVAYLRLDRGARTLTGGESQRVRLASQGGSGLQGVMYVLDEPSIRQLRQRITFAYEIQPLSRVCMEHYVNHRLAVAGYSGAPPIAPRALDALYRGSDGIPRLVNILMHKAMMAAFSSWVRWRLGREGGEVRSRLSASTMSGVGLAIARGK